MSGPPEPAEARDVHPLRNPTFLLVWGGQSVSLIGSGISSIAIIWWVFVETGSTVILATVAIAGTIPRVLAGPFAGAYVDRWDRRRIMMVLDGASGVAVVIGATAIFLGVLEIWHLYVLMAVLGLAAIFHATSLFASVPNIVHQEQLSRANSLMQISHSTSGVLGPALGGVLIVLLGVGPTLWIDGGTFLLASLTLLLVRFFSPRSTSEKTVLADIAVGFRFLRNAPPLLTMLLLFGAVNFLLVPLVILLPQVATVTLGLGPEGFGFLQASVAGGLLAGGLIFAVVKLQRGFGRNVVLAVVLVGGGYVLFGLSEVFPLSAAGLFTIGIAASLAGVCSSTVFQREVPLDLQGRVFSARMVLAMGLQPISLATVGIMAELIGIQALMVGSGLLIVLAGFVGYTVKGLREL